MLQNIQIVFSGVKSNSYFFTCGSVSLIAKIVLSPVFLLIRIKEIEVLDSKTVSTKLLCTPTFSKKVNQTAIEKLRSYGIFEGMPESSQLSLF